MNRNKNKIKLKIMCCLIDKNKNNKFSLYWFRLEKKRIEINK